ncbi:MAG: hypothetical protein PVF87_05245 [Acidimicrobiia bacterium]|jgi:hypothetical protein
MAKVSQLARIGGSTLAGAVGYVVGFYAGLFVLLSSWGLETDELAFVVVAGGLGVVVAGVAVALTVSRARRWRAFLATIGLGVVLVPLLLLFDADPVGMALGGLAMVAVTSTLTRTGVLDPTPG